MSAEPSLGIVVPNYNNARFLGAAIASALAQEGTPPPVVVVDDGSTDDSRELLRAFRDRVEIVLQDNRGHVAACLAGARRLSTEVVIFLDADDLLAPDAARTVRRVWRPGLSKVQFRMEVVDAQGRGTGVVFPKYPRDTDHASMLRESLRTGGYPAPPTSGNAYAARLLERIEQPCALRFVDTILNTIAPFEGEVLTIPDVLSRYRLHDQNAYLSAQLDPERIRKRLEDERERLRFLVAYARRHEIELELDSLVQASRYYGEHRLALARLEDPGRPGRPGRASATLDLVASTLASSEDLRLKLVKLLWTLAVGLGPATLARALIRRRLVPTARSPAFERLISRLVGAR